MSHLHRIQWFDEQIRAGNYPSSAQLSERFEISRRQAQRDIEYLAASLRAPLVYVAKHRGYAYEDDSFRLPPLYTTEEEKRVLRYLSYRYRQYDHEQGPLVRRIGDLLDRLVSEEQPGTGFRVPVFEVNPERVQRVELLERAVREGGEITVTVSAAEGSQTLSLWPVGLTPHLDDDYLVARRDEEERLEQFPLSTIREVKIVDRKLSHPESARQMVSRQGLRPFTANIRLAAPLEAGHWGGFAVSSCEQDWIEVEFVDAELFYRHMLTAEWLELARPRWLRERLNARCEAMLKALGESEEERHNDAT